MAQSSVNIEIDRFDDDSDLPSSIDNFSYMTTIASSVWNYPTAAGIIHTMRGNMLSFVTPKVFLTIILDLILAKPNDEKEQDRLDLNHHIYLMLLKGALHLAPIKATARVLDLGTGTGIWAIDFSDEHPESEVIGVDLSPIQPSWTPPNCRFEVDNYEQSWPFNAPFDYIHGRDLEGAIRDHDKLFRQAFNNLRPNGWFEMSGFEVNIMSDDNTHLKATCLLNVIQNIQISSRIFGKNMASVPSWRCWMMKAGFANVQEIVYKLPLGPWSTDPQLQELGRYEQFNMLEALPSYTYALFTRVLGLQRLEIEALLAGARCELRDPSKHLYTRVYIVYGQKPYISS